MCQGLLRQGRQGGLLLLQARPRKEGRVHGGQGSRRQSRSGRRRTGCSQPLRHGYTRALGLAAPAVGIIWGQKPNRRHCQKPCAGKVSHKVLPFFGGVYACFRQRLCGFPFKMVLGFATLSAMHGVWKCAVLWKTGGIPKKKNAGKPRGCWENDGVDDGIRTRNDLNHNQVLYQVELHPPAEAGGSIAEGRGGCKRFLREEAKLWSCGAGSRDGRMGA